MPFRQALLAGAALLMLAGSPGHALAEDALVDELLVTADSLEETLALELSRYGHDLAILEGATVRDRGYLDASQALRMAVPGLHIAPRSGPFSYVDVSLQGSRTGDVLWLVDGVRINNRLYTSTSPADTLPAAMIDRVEVLKGGESLFYGTQAAAGVINIVTRDFSETFDGEVRLGAHSDRGVHASAYARGGAGGHHLVAWASKDEAEGFEAFDVYQPSATARRRGYDVVGLGLKYGYALSEDMALQAQYHHVDARLDYPNPRLTHLSFNDRDEDIVSVRFDYAPAGPLQLFLKGYFHSWDSVYTTVENDLLDPGRLNVVDENTYWGFQDYGLNAVGKITASPGLEIHLGYDFQTYSGRDDVLRVAEQEESAHAVFAHVRSTPQLLSRARLAAGVRHNETNQASATVWHVSGRFDLTSDLFLEAAAGTSFLLPSAEQLFAVDPCCARGNPELKPEGGENLNLSIGSDQAGLAWRLTGFWRRIDHLILDDYSDPALPDGIYRNTGGRVRMEGVDASLTADLTRSLRLEASYTYARAREAGSSLQVARIPREVAKAAISYAPEDRPFGASVSALWTGDVQAPVAGFGRVDYGDHLVVDLAGQLHLDGRAGRRRLGMSIENLFDTSYGTRVGSALIDGGGGERFLYRFRGSPRTLRVTLSVGF